MPRDTYHMNFITWYLPRDAYNVTCTTWHVLRGEDLSKMIHHSSLRVMFGFVCKERSLLNNIDAIFVSG